MLIMVTQPAEVESRKARIHCVPAIGSSMADKLFFTANPTLCSLASSWGLPYQKKVFSRSHSRPLSASLVSCRVIMSTFSVESWHWWWQSFWGHQSDASHPTGCIAWCSSLRVVGLEISSFSLLVFLVRCYSLLSVFVLSSKHPLKQTNCGELAPI